MTNNLGLLGLLLSTPSSADGWVITSPAIEMPSSELQPAYYVCYKTNARVIDAYVVDDSGFAEPLIEVFQSENAICYVLPILETRAFTLAGTYAHRDLLEKKTFYVFNGEISVAPFAKTKEPKKKRWGK